MSALFALGWIMSRAFGLSKIVVALVVLSSPAVSKARADTDTAAHALAEKFADADADAKRKAEARKIKDETARLEAARRAAERLKIEEAEMLERARAEAAEREAARRAEDEHRLAQEKARQDELARNQETEQRALEAKRQEEALNLSEKLRRAREQREASRDRRIETPADNEPLDRPQFLSGPKPTFENDRWVDEAPAVTPPPAVAEAPHRALWPEQNVTILLVMEPGDRGIRRFDKSADAVLCLGHRCYAGMGSTTPAKLMTRGAALGPANTLGARAWGCRHTLTCIYRNVDLGGESGSIQPIDLKVLRHDRREIRSVKADLSCEVDAAGRLYCANIVRTRTWRAWIVPESVANHAGGVAIEAALKSGLSDQRSAELQ